MAWKVGAFDLVKCVSGVKQKPDPASSTFPVSAPMSSVFRLLLGLSVLSGLHAQRPIGEVVVDVDGTKSTEVTIDSSSPELRSLAITAFTAHGAYRPVASGGAYHFEFTPAGANQVTVKVSRGRDATPVLTQTVGGTSLRNALLRAADAVVTATSKLPGWFAGRLVFVSERNGQNLLVTGDVFFGELQSHPVGTKAIIGPRWSPDGSRIVFTSYRTGVPDIYQLDLNNRQLTLFASFKGTNSGARFSPDGSHVAMVLSGEGNPEVYVGNAQGKQIRRLTRNSAIEASPCWSPDSAKLVFTSDSAGGPQLYVMPAGGGTMSRLPTNISRYCAEPDWSVANPKKIVFTAGVGRGYQVAVYDMGSGESKFVTKAPTDAVEPVWLADGRHIVCTFRGTGTRRLFVVDTESGKAVALSPSSFGSAGNASYLPPRR